MVRTGRRFLPIALAVAFLLTMALAGPSLRHAAARYRLAYASGETDASLQERNQSAFAQILGEVRATASDLIFMKTGRYLHAGVAYAPRLKVDSVNADKHFGGCAPGTPTLIRIASEDFRGFLGELERQIKPFRDPSLDHIHTTKRELVPWFRLMTMSNPHYIRGYRVGGMTLADEGRWQEALDFMSEGVRRNQDNPELFLLYQTLASFHMRGRFAKTYPWGEAWLDKALEAALKAFELGLRQRPPLGRAGETRGSLSWTEDLEEDFQYSAHIIPLLWREKGELGKAVEYARRIADLAPNSGPIQQTLRTLLREASEGETSARGVSQEQEKEQRTP